LQLIALNVLPSFLGTAHYCEQVLSSLKLGKSLGQLIDIATLQRNHSVPFQAPKPHVLQLVLKEFV